MFGSSNDTHTFFHNTFNQRPELMRLSSESNLLKFYLNWRLRLSRPISDYHCSAHQLLTFQCRFLQFHLVIWRITFEMTRTWFRFLIFVSSQFHQRWKRLNRRKQMESCDGKTNISALIWDCRIQIFKMLKYYLSTKGSGNGKYRQIHRFDSWKPKLRKIRVNSSKFLHYPASILFSSRFAYVSRKVERKNWKRSDHSIYATHTLSSSCGNELVGEFVFRWQ